MSEASMLATGECGDISSLLSNESMVITHQKRIIIRIYISAYKRNNEKS